MPSASPASIPPSNTSRPIAPVPSPSSKCPRSFRKADVIVASTNSEQLVVTNLTGHPACIVPNGLRGDDAPAPPAIDTGDDDQIGGPGTPVSLTFLAGHYQDAKLCAFARAYQQATGFEKLHPKLPS